MSAFLLIGGNVLNTTTGSAVLGKPVGFFPPRNVEGLRTMSRKIIQIALLYFVSGALNFTQAALWLIATPDESARSGVPIMLDVVKPASQVDWPATLRLRIANDSRTLEMELTPVEPTAEEGIRRSYRGVLPSNLSGLARVDLAGVQSNRLALLIATPDAIQKMQADGASESPDKKSNDIGQLLFPVNEPALSANEPMYFVIGGGDGATARFQLSFKYRIFDPDSLPVEWFSPLSGLHFGYTQTSLWDIGSDSAPFHDTSYKPSFFWQGASLGKGLMPDLLRGGFEHESNGKDGTSSRSINILFLQPVWSTAFADGRALIFAPKFYGYLDKDDNPEIQRYRGYADWIFRYGREDSWVLTTQLRRGTTGHGSAQLDLSYPLRRQLFARTGGYLHFQLFKGYGESLLDYGIEQDLQARVGFSIVR